VLRMPAAWDLLRCRATVERLAVQREARRATGSLMLHQCPCGGIFRCNGFMASAHRPTVPPLSLRILDLAGKF